MKIVQFCSPISQLIITVGITQNQAKTHFQTKDQIKTKLTKQQKKPPCKNHKYVYKLLKKRQPDNNFDKTNLSNALPYFLSIFTVKDVD